MKPLRVLFVEDVEEDSFLISRELRRGGFDVSSERVDTEEAMASALDLRTFDVVISDWSMPRFSGPMALGLVKKRGLKLPFIIVSGTVSEEIAVEALHAGAHDFMAKDKLTRLNNAVMRGLQAVALRAEKAKVEEQLLVSDRMATVGGLATNIAHEINNPVAALLANLGFLAEDLAAMRRDAAGLDGRIAERLEGFERSIRDAREASERVRDIAFDLGIFSRSEDDRNESVDLRRVIESSVRMAKSEIRYRAGVSIELEDELPPVRGSEGRLGQVFLNLILNAAQSIPVGMASANVIRIVGRREGDRAIVEVRDSGEGIPAESLGKIFEPFYSTRPKGSGAGLGLSICRRIVSGLEGALVVESEAGRGTVVRVELTSAARVRAPAPQLDEEPGSGPRGRVLVVDDEPMIHSAVKRMLEPEHDVVGITTVREAIERAADGEHFDAVLCELMMPELTGMDLFAELADLSGGLSDRVIFMSGGVFPPEARAFLDRLPNPRLEKPFDTASVRQVVRRVMR